MSYKTFQNFQDYITSLSVVHKKVLHTIGGRKSFFRMDGEEDTAAISTDATSPMVAIAGFSGQVQQQTRLVYRARILFLSHVPESATESMADEIEEAQNEAFEVMMDFWSRIVWEYENGDKCAFMNELLNPSFEPVGPINQWEYGWAMDIYFSVDSPDYNPANWN